MTPRHVGGINMQLPATTTISAATVPVTVVAASLKAARDGVRWRRRPLRPLDKLPRKNEGKPVDTGTT